MNEYYGTVGERLRDLDLTLVNRYSFNGMYGTTYLESYADDKGRTFIWRGKGSDAYVGQKVTLTGTVKEHNEFRETKQTVLTRCKAIVQEDSDECRNERS